MRAERLELSRCAARLPGDHAAVLAAWVERMEKVGGTPVGDALRSAWCHARGPARALGWRTAKADRRRRARPGFAGIVLMGLRSRPPSTRPTTLWHDDRITPLFSGNEA